METPDAASVAGGSGRATAPPSLIVRVIKRYRPDWVAPPDTGREWLKCLCPWHGDGTASAAVSYEHNAFGCLACPAKGSATTLIMNREGVTYSAAKRIATELSEGSYKPVPRKHERISGRKVFGESRPVPHERSSPEVPARIRRRTFSGPGDV